MRLCPRKLSHPPEHFQHYAFFSILMKNKFDMHSKFFESKKKLE